MIMNSSIKCQIAMHKIAGLGSYIQNNWANPAIDWLAPKVGGDATNWKQIYANNPWAFNLGALGLTAAGISRLGRWALGGDDEEKRRNSGGGFGDWILPIGLTAAGIFYDKYGRNWLKKYDQSIKDRAAIATNLRDITQTGSQIIKGIKNISGNLKFGWPIIRATVTGQTSKNPPVVGSASGAVGDNQTPGSTQTQTPAQPQQSAQSQPGAAAQKNEWADAVIGGGKALYNMYKSKQ